MNITHNLQSFSNLTWQHNCKTPQMIFKAATIKANIQLCSGGSKM